MIPTIPVYYQTPYLRELSVRVVALVEEDGALCALTDRSICYPEGGGQPGDTGWLGNCRIIDTRKDAEGRILHLLEKDCQLAVGDQLTMVLDWEHRFDFMQQHTAQHLISGILYSLMGIGTVSVHFGQEMLTIETDQEHIPLEKLYATEDQVNAIVRMHVPVTYEELPRQEAETRGLRRSIKVEGLVRLVHIGDYDVIACGGVHVDSSDQIVQVLCIGAEHIRGHVRTQWLAGKRAMASIRRNHHIVETLGALLSAQPHELVEKCGTLKQLACDAQYQWQKAQSALIASQLEKLTAPFAGTAAVPVVTLDVSQEENPVMRQFGEAAAEYDDLALCVVQERSDGTLLWLIVLRGKAASTLDSKHIRAQLFPLIDAKGGGKPPLWQGVGTNVQGKEQFLAQFARMVQESARE
jgi:alanyl-tRNA synthetase